ncbi:tRNA uridine-5-carboxymethylaminomethyl(34) synthesis GTPase MnmE [Tindallia californiensis]|uniref:tRNA modification GTPase MnmE n=1 Tax=Tindallia californiensis TaxID=159292 RepID=A0A1H3PU95_9FIRM|nr:tRNA uridine-5-carboxymethylaminomethyl(34) synthesis GTPase MnmE [Tindallia californiensis]SDZ04415.1 tRNA modification GTPase trmE [Tindallia californiensis]
MEDTIAAISTASGEAGIGIIRISGTESLQKALMIYETKNGKKVTRLQDRRLTYGKIMDPHTGKMIDEALVCYMKAPHTYTTEDVVEIQCHGGYISLKRIMEALLDQGVRSAEPGEFTKRAFLSGRLDLSQAEAVMDLIGSKTDLSHEAALGQLEGFLSGKVKKMREELLDLMAAMEVSIDFSEEEDIDEVTFEDVYEKTIPIMDDIQWLIDSAKTGKIIREGLKTVIIGKPNVGKSSLMNALLKESRAIVTDIPGTTRDVIEEQLNLRGIPLVLMDTAGIRDTEDVVEKMGVERAKQLFDQADLVMMMLDASTPVTSEEVALLNMVQKRKALIIINKTDLPSVLDESSLPEWIDSDQILKLSLLESSGLLQLEEALENLVYDGEKNAREKEMVTHLRHQQALEKAYDSLKEGVKALESRMPLDFVQVDYQEAMDQLGAIIGESVKEDLIDHIFSNFCIGK